MKNLTKEQVQEMNSDLAMYLHKAKRHGEEALFQLYQLLNSDAAVAHAKLAASHARRAQAIEAQLNA